MRRVTLWAIRCSDGRFLTHWSGVYDAVAVLSFRAKQEAAKMLTVKGRRIVRLCTTTERQAP